MKYLLPKKSSILTFLLLLLSLSGWCCTCFATFERKWLDSVTKNASYIFYGKVSKVVIDIPTGEPIRTEFQVIEVVKGNPGHTIVVDNSIRDTCGVYFLVGEYYLVVADLSQTGVLPRTDMCSSWSRDQWYPFSWSQKTFNLLMQGFRDSARGQR